MILLDLAWSGLHACLIWFSSEDFQISSKQVLQSNQIVQDKTESVTCALVLEFQEHTECN